MVLRWPAGSAAALFVAISPVSAQPGGQVIQAFSDDPDWTVVINPDRVSYTHMEADYPVFNLLAAPTVVRSDGKPVYRTRFSDGTLVELKITEAACKQRGETFALSASLTVGGEQRKGCAQQLEFYELGPPLVLGDFAMDAPIRSHGGPKGFAVELQSGAGILSIGGREYALGQPTETILLGQAWPIIAEGVATFQLVSDDGAVAAQAVVKANPCSFGGKAYPMAITVTFEGKKYESCAAQEYLAIRMPGNIPSVALP